MRSRAQIKSHPIHPMLIAFPIGLWVTSFVLDLLGTWRSSPSLWAAGFWCVICGCVGAVAAAIPGAIDLFTIVPPRSSAWRRGLMHGLLNLTVLGIFIAVAVRRGTPDVRPDSTALLLSLVGVGILAVSGWLGGTLVFRNQIGVDRRYANAGKQRERELEGWDRPACHEGELAHGQMMLIRVDGQRITLGRCLDGIVAFGDSCTHKGGPLSDGALIGCTVQCPWHGSQFDVHSGRVVAGPAQRKIITYETRVANGEVYILRPTSAEHKPQDKAA